MRLHSLRRLLGHAATAGSVLEARLRNTGVFSEVVEAFDKAEACRQAEDQARDAVFRRQLSEIQSGQSSRTIPQIVREARKRLRAKKHRLQLSARLNQEISTALREKILDGSRDVRLAAGSTWKVEDNLDELDIPARHVVVQEMPGNVAWNRRLSRASPRPVLQWFVCFYVPQLGQDCRWGRATSCG